MKKLICVAVFILSMIGCGSSSDNYKYYERIVIEKDGSVSLSGEIVDQNAMPTKYHKVYFKKDGRVDKEHFMTSGDVKRSSAYLYDDNGKVIEVRHFENKKYNGVSRYVYGTDGNIEKEMVFDKELNFQFSKKL